MCCKLEHGQDATQNAKEATVTDAMGALVELQGLPSAC